MHLLPSEQRAVRSWSCHRLQPPLWFFPMTDAKCKSSVVVCYQNQIIGLVEKYASFLANDICFCCKQTCKTRANNRLIPFMSFSHKWYLESSVIKIPCQIFPVMVRLNPRRPWFLLSLHCNHKNLWHIRWRSDGIVLFSLWNVFRSLLNSCGSGEV